MYMGVYACIFFYMCVYLWSCGIMCVWLRGTTISVRSGPVWWDPYGRFGFMSVMDPIHCRFKNRPMGWFGGSYRFVRWRQDGDSDPKPHHFMWVFVYWSISISVFLPYCLMRFYILFCIIFFIPATIVISWYSHIVLLIYHYSVSNTVIDLFWYSRQVSIGHDFPH